MSDPQRECSCTGFPDYEGPCPWCDVHGQPSVAWDQGRAEGVREERAMAALSEADLLRARVVELESQVGILSNRIVGPLPTRDALKARVAEQEIAFAEKLAGAADASTRHVKQLSERVDLLTAALTGLCDVYHARPLNELLDGEETVSEDDGPKFAAWANARAVLSATPTSPRYVVQNRGAAWAVHDNERHMDISLYTDEQFTQEFCQRMNTTPTGSET